MCPFLYLMWVNLHISPIRQMGIVSPFNRWKNWDLEVIELITGEARHWTQGVWPQMLLIIAIISPESDWGFQSEYIQPEVKRDKTLMKPGAGATLTTNLVKQWAFHKDFLHLMRIHIPVMHGSDKVPLKPSRWWWIHLWWTGSFICGTKAI